VTNCKNSFELIAFCGGAVSTQDVFYVNSNYEKAYLDKFGFVK